MSALIQINSFPVRTVLNILLQDKTTMENIIWATNSYRKYGKEYSEDRQITENALLGHTPILIQPRVLKTLEQQQERTKSRGEVLTPTWICNKMNNYCDEEWFNRKNVFNIECEQSWRTNTDKIHFAEHRTWKHYVDSRRLEITCGEAPYIVSRYDDKGNIISVKDRIGILDRKLRVVGENTETQEDWYKWAIRAFQSVYGYEYQGDNLLIGRINLLMTFVEYLNDRWQCNPTIEALRKIANIIAWNLWQMDGLIATVPFKGQNNKDLKCKIYDWRANRSILYESMKKEEVN